MLTLPDAWAWDFWTADDGERFHLFYLNAPRTLGDPDLRHHNAGVGHAVSADLRTWTSLPDALVAAPPPAPDDLAIWTGCVIRAPDGWHMYYTGATDVDGHTVQTTCLATSPDLVTWTRDPRNPLLRADPRWYEVLGESWPGENWRDPWVYPDPGGDGWHMLVTARARGDRSGHDAPDQVPDDDRGVVGAAWSPDLRHWATRPPRSAPGAGFGQLEVMQREVVGEGPAGRTVLLFSCLRPELAAARAAAVRTGGVWAVTAPPGRTFEDGPIDVASAQLLVDDRFYVGKLVRDRNGGWVLLAFHNRGPDGTFVGEISDPMPVVMTPDGLRLA